MCSPGGFDERKNIHNLIIAYSNLPPGLRKTHQLLITSQITHKDAKIIYDFAKKHGLGKDELILSGYVPNEDLIALYNLCELFVFPSLYEGFGLPALEAMACGTPVIVSNGGALPEVVSDAALVFDLSSTDGLAGSMMQCLHDQELRQLLIEAGLARAHDFSWKRTAELIWKTLNAI